MLDNNSSMQKILVTRPSMPPIEEYFDEIKSIWETHWLTNMGPKHDEFRIKLKEYLSVDNIEVLVNGHMSLEMTLQAMNLQGEVITTPFTFASTTHAIVRNGLKPVFCDIDPKTYTMDVTKLESLISDKTSAILPVHVYGNICDIEEIQRIAEKYELKVIYDAAHCFGEKYKDVGIGNYGDASIFSFHATKVFNSIEGGAVCYRDDSLGKRLDDLKDFGIHSEEEIFAVGANAKINEFSCAMGICNLRHIDEEIQKRKRINNRYVERLYGIKGITLNPSQDDVERNYSYFPIVIEPELFGFSRQEVVEKLAKEEVYARKYFHPLTNTFFAYNGKFNVEMTPVALHISRRVLTLPMYADLSSEDVDRICDVIVNMAM